MRALTRLIEIRARQCYRLLASVGWPLLVIGIPIIIIFFLGIFERSTEGYYLSILFLLALASVHFSRRDKWHLVHLGYVPQQVFLIEYVVVAFILGITQWILVHTAHNLGVMLLGSVIMVTLPQIAFTDLRKYLFFPVNWVPVDYFEWRTGIRKYGWLLLMLSIVCSVFSYISPIFPIVGVILLSLIATSWYKDFEPMSMLVVDERVLQFLSRKIFQAVVWVILLALPIIVSFLLYHSELWHLLLVAFIFAWLIVSFAICYKYAGYHPSRKSAQSDLAVAIFSYSALVPFFMPVCFVYLFIYARRAIQNISSIHARS